MSNRTFNVLFLCTGNSAHSILAEAILNHLGKGRFQGYSAGSLPKGEVHPVSLQVLRQHGLPTEGLRRKVGMSSRGPMRPSSTSFSRFATTRLVKSARYGRATR